MMDMPTPCPQCGDIVELNSMNTCDNCRELFCKNCLEQPWTNCDDCKLLIEDEEDEEEA